MFDNPMMFFVEEPTLGSVEDAREWIAKEWAEYDGRWWVVDGDHFRLATKKEETFLEEAAEGSD